MTRRVAVQIDLARPIGRVRCHGFPEKRLRRFHTSIGAQQVVDGLSISVDSPVEMVKSPTAAEL
jgi:hypothetical protein